jgi:hypothetical protein
VEENVVEAHENNKNTISSIITPISNGNTETLKTVWL